MRLLVRLSLLSALLPAVLRAQVIPDWASGSPPVTTIGAGQTLNIVTGNVHSVGTATVSNSGTINFLGGSITVGTGGALINAATGTFVDNSTSSLSFTTGDFSNLGVYRKTGTGTTTLAGNLTHSGSIQVQAGVLSLGGTSNSTGSFNVSTGATLNVSGTAAFKDGASITGTGTANLTSGGITVSSGTSSFSNFTLNGGTLSGAGSASFGTLNSTSGGLAISAFTLTGNSTWSGGNWNATANATGTIAATTTLNLTGTGAKDFNFRTLTNQGTVNWQGGQLRSGNNGGFVNAAGATFNDSASNSINAVYGGAVAFTNAGTYNKSAAGNTTVSVPFTSTGTVNVTAGVLDLSGGGHSSGNIVLGATSAALRLSGSNFEIRSGSVLTGPGTVEIAGPAQFVDTVTGTANLNVASGGNLAVTGNTTLSGGGTFSGGTFGGPGTLALGAPLTLSGTTLSGAGTLRANGGVAITGAFSLQGGRTLDLGGNSTWTGGYIYAGGNSVINLPASATFSTSFDGTLNGTYYDGPAGRTQFNNAGTFTKTTGAANSSTDISAAFNNSGTVQVQGGTLELSGGGTHSGTTTLATGATLQLSGGNHTFSSGAQINGAGNLRISGGNTTFAGAATGSANIVIAAGNAAFNGTTNTTGGGTLSGGSLAGTGSVTFGGPVTLNGTTLTGASALVANSGVAITNSFSINASRTLTLGGNSTWTGGYIYAGGNSVFSLPAGATFSTSFDGTLNGTYYDGPAGRTQFNNAGTFIKTTGAANSSTDISAAFNNSGTVQVQGGTLELSGGGTHAGTTTLATGATLQLSGGTHAFASGAQINGAGNLRISGGNTTFAGAATGSANIVIAAGNAAFNGTTNTTGSGTLSGGSLAGTGSVTFGGPVTLNGTTLTGAGTLAANSGVAITNSFSINASRTLALGGNSTWTGGYIYAGGNSVLSLPAGATFSTSFDGTLNGTYYDGPAGRTQFNNAGTFTKTTGAANSSTDISAAFNNSGTVQVQGGTLELSGGGTHSGTTTLATGATLQLSGGNHTFSSGAQINGAGNLRISGGNTTFAGAATGSANIVIAGGNAAFDGTTNTTGGGTLSGGSLTGTGSVTFGGPVTLNGTTLTGAGNLVANGGVAITNSFSINASRTLTLGGNSTWSGGYIYAGGNSVLNIPANITLSTGFDGVLNGTYYGGPASRSQVNIAGTFTKTAGASNDTTFITAALNQTGLVSVQAGTLQIAGGGVSSGRTEIATGASVSVTDSTYTLAGNATVTGPGTFKVFGGTLAITDTPSIAQFFQSAGTVSGTGNLSLSNLTLAGGNLAPNGVTLTGNGTWNSGSMNGAGTTTIASGSTLTLGSGASHDFNLRAIVNQGTVNWTHEYIRGGNGSVFTNHGTFVDAHTSGWTLHSAFGGSTTFVNHGTYRRAPGSNTVSYLDVPFTNNGTVEVLSGSLQFRAGGTLASSGTISAASGSSVTFTNGFTVANGASLTGAGTFGLTGGTLDVSGTFNVPVFNQTGGILEGINTLNGIVNWAGGNWSTTEAGRSTTIAAAATLNLTNGGAKDFNRRALVNQGTVNWTHEFIRGGNGSVFTNHGTFIDAQASGWSIHNAFGGTFSFVNHGTYRRAPGSNTISYLDVPFTNHGTVEVASGSLQFRAGGTLAATGRISAATGTSVTFTEGFTIADGASLTGTGTFGLTGGNLSLTGTLNVSAFNQTGGVLSGTHAINGVYNWSSGNWNADTAGQTTTILAGSTLNLTSGAAKDFNRRAIVNQGTVNWTHEYIRGGNGSVFTNHGTFVDAHTSGWTLHSAFGGSTTFVNNGTYRRAPGSNTVSYLDVPFTNNGTVEVLSGSLQFRAGGTLASNATMSAAAGTNVVFTEGFTIANASSLSGAGSFQLTGGILNVTGAVSVGTFNQTGGTLAGTHSLLGTYNWTSGNWNAEAAGFQTTIAAGATLNLATGSSKDFNRRTVVNQGNAVWTSGYLRGGNGSVFTNAGTFQDRNASGYSLYAAYGGSFVFNNSGTYIREAADVTYFDVPFNNSGTVDLRSGSIQLREGGTMSGSSLVNAAANTSFLFTNSYTILDGAEFTGAGTFTQTGGSLAINGTLKAPAFNWQGGNWNTDSAATTTIGTGTTLNLISGSSKDLAGRTVVNRGTVNWNSGNLAGGKGGSFTNAAGATFNDINVSGYTVHNGHGGSFVFTNEGTYVRNTGGTTYFDTAFVNLGTVNLQSGVIQLRDGGSMGATSVFNTSPGATLFIASNYTLLTGARFTGAGSVIHSAGNLTVDGVLQAATFTWEGGTWNSTTRGATTIDATSAVTLTSGNNKDFRGRTLRNEGTLNWVQGYVRGGDGSLLLNAPGGTFNDRNASGYSFHNPFGGSFAFRNEGTYVRDVGNVTYFDIPFENAGTVQVRQGSVQIRQGGTMAATGVVDVSAGASLLLTNGYTLQNGSQFTGAGNVVLTGGTLVADVLRASNFTWEGGNFNSTTPATTTVAKGSTLRLTSGNNKDFSGRALVNEGTVVWQSGYIRGGDGSTFTNATGATFNDQNSSGYTIHNGFGGTFSFLNEGTYLKSTSGTTRIEVPFTNNGTLSIQAGTVQFTSTFTNNGGLQFANGASAFFPGPVTFNQPLGGTGTINGSVTAASSVSPGTSPGTLTITGNLTLLATSSLLLEIGGTVQGSGYDFLNVQGNATLGGTLSLSLLGSVGTTILPTDTFTVMRAGGTAGLTGAFANIVNGGRMLTSDGGGFFTVNYGAGSAFAANSVVLSDFQAIPEPSTYALLALGALALFLSRRRK